MSLSARVWARDVEIPAGKAGAARFVPSMLRHLLKEIADFDQGTGEVYGFVSTLSRYTDMDRKTVIAYLDELVTRGMLRDTGKRAGRTKQTPIYQLVGFLPDFERTRAPMPKSPAGGTLSENTQLSSADGLQPTESSGNFDDSKEVEADETERVPSAGLLDGERLPPAVPVPSAVPVPPRSAKGPAEERKGSRRRDTNSSLNSTEHLDAGTRASAQARARPAGQSELDKFDVPRSDPARAYWASMVLQAFLDSIWNDDPEREFTRRAFAAMPSSLQLLVHTRARPIIDQLVDAEGSTGQRNQAMRDSMESAVRAEVIGERVANGNGGLLAEYRATRVAA